MQESNNLDNSISSNTVAKKEKAANYLDQGIKLHKEEKWEESISCFKQALSLDPYLFWAHHLLGFAFERQGQRTEAISAWRQALKTGGEQVDKSWTYFYLALGLEKEGKLEESLKFCQQAVRLKPEQSDFFALLSTLMTKKTLAEIRTDKESIQIEKNPQILYIPSQSSDAENSLVLRSSSSQFKSFSPTIFPIPPLELMEYGESEEFHLSAGEETVNTMRKITKEVGHDLGKCQRILEFGCSNARLLRWLTDLADKREIWGVDIQADKIFWAIEHMSPPFHFAVNTTVPHLPFQDNYFDFIFAGSIFTHINELHIAWLLELSRILAPSGVMYITFNDESTLELLNSENNRSRVSEILHNHPLGNQIFANEFDFVSVLPYSKGMLSQVFMRERYIRKVTSGFLKVVKTYPGAYSKFQTAYLLAPSKTV